MVKIFKLGKLPKVITWVIVVIIFAGLAYILGWSNILSVKEINFSGTPQSDLIAKQLSVSVPGLRVGEPMARLNLPAISKGISAVSWIEKSSISRNWLTGKINISLVPRTPVAAIDSGEGQVKYLDAAGFEFTEPVAISGLAQVSLRSQDSSSRLAASQFISQMPDDLLAAMRTLLVGGAEPIVMTSDLTGKVLTINWGNSNNAAELSAKVRVLRTLISLPENQKITHLDLSNLRSPVVK